MSIETSTNHSTILLSRSSCRLGPILESKIAFLSTGHTPVFLNPALIWFTVMAFTHAGENTQKNSAFDSFLAPLDLTYWCIPSNQAPLKLAKGTSSRGCRQCVVWAGNANTWMLFSFISLMNWKLNVWLLCESIRKRLCLSGPSWSILQRYSISFLP